MKKLPLILIFCLFAHYGYSQQRAAVWYFGNRAGIDFSGGLPVPVNGNQMVAEKGCSVVCNREGQIQFYTNGILLWNRKGGLMAGCDSLHGSQYLNQNSIIVPQPLSDSVYWLFTVNGSDSVLKFTYSIVDMNRQNGLGEVTLLNDTLLSMIVEKVSAVKHCNGRDYWIVTHDISDIFYSFRLTPDGITEKVTSKVGGTAKADIGYLKISPAGDKIVMPLNNENVLAELCDFDNKTGRIAHPLFIYRKNPDTYCFGIEFSPDGNMLYMTTGGKHFNLWQFDLRNKTEDGLNNSGVKISSGNNFAMQLAPDGKIYIARENTPYLNAVKHPDRRGIDCGYEAKSLFLHGREVFKGLPNFVQSWFYTPSFDARNLCFGDTSRFVFLRTGNIDSLIWRFNPAEDNPVVKGNAFEINRYFHDTVQYRVSVAAYHCGISDTVTENIKVNPYPPAVLPEDTLICNNCTITLTAGPADNYLWNNGSVHRSIEVDTPGNYSVKMEKNGCINYDSVRVYLKEPDIWFPNAFTPNGDGLNDEFKPLVTDKPLSFQMWIYSRNGTLLFYSQDFSKGWDGTFEGKPVPVSTYIWIINFKVYNKQGYLTEKTKRGSVTLIR